MAVTVHSLEIVGVVYAFIWPPEGARLRLAHDVMDFIGRRDTKAAAKARGTLTQSSIPGEYDASELAPRCTVSAFLGRTACIITPPGRGGSGWSQARAQGGKAGHGGHSLGHD